LALFTDQPDCFLLGNALDAGHTLAVLRSVITERNLSFKEYSMRTFTLGHRTGRTPIEISSITLGTMTFGEQNTEAQSHALLDIAVANGVTSLDVAEMYPVAPRAETQGRSEEIIGTWLKARGNRDRVIIASKVAGHGGMEWIRGPKRVLDATNIAAAVDGSLKRLQTDYIDLYYLHWPDRETNTFGRLGYRHNPNDTFPDLAETLYALGQQVQAGKIRHIGVSNETPWGLHSYLKLAEQDSSLPRMAAIQNPYSLVNRTFEVGLAEMAIREDVPLLGYAPLAAGILTGKYENGALPVNSRRVLWPERFTRYTKPQALLAAERYVQIARRHGLDPAQMALAFACHQPFVASAIIGATTPKQLEMSLSAQDMSLSINCIEEIQEAHQTIPNPAP
jgi:aryl-alcohol dehydrogenase-like predicted oxidoreductase